MRRAGSAGGERGTKPLSAMEQAAETQYLAEEGSVVAACSNMDEPAAKRRWSVGSVLQMHRASPAMPNDTDVSIPATDSLED